MGNMILDKMTTRNFIALSMVGTLVYSVIKAMNSPEMVSVALENPLITYIMGTFTSGIMLVLYFYFRKSQAKES